MKSCISLILASREKLVSRNPQFGCLRRFTETAEYLGRSLASITMRYFCSTIGCFIFDHDFIMIQNKRLFLYLNKYFFYYWKAFSYYEFTNYYTFYIYFIFRDIIGSRKHIATYNLHIIKPTAFWRPVMKRTQIWNLLVFTIYSWISSTKTLFLTKSNVLFSNNDKSRLFWLSYTQTGYTVKKSIPCTFKEKWYSFFNSMTNVITKKIVFNKISVKIRI